ncbi:MAG: hypothetical protein NTV59_08225 [Chloroflexi bacterium]|nr:hypothetical protein [Chloroflexota bacterium]
MASEPEKYLEAATEGAVKGWTNAFLEFIATSRWSMKLHHLPWTIKKWEKEGTYPALMTVKSIKVPAWSMHELVVKFEIHLTPRVAYYLSNFAIRKKPKSSKTPSEIQDWLFNGKNSVFPQIHLDERPLPMREYEPPYDHSPILINQTIDQIYHCSEATFVIPYESGEGKVNIQVLAKTHDTRGKYYEVCSEWMEL